MTLSFIAMGLFVVFILLILCFGAKFLADRDLDADLITWVGGEDKE